MIPWIIWIDKCEELHTPILLNERHFHMNTWILYKNHHHYHYQKSQILYPFIVLNPFRFWSFVVNLVQHINRWNDEKETSTLLLVKSDIKITIHNYTLKVSCLLNVITNFLNLSFFVWRRIEKKSYGFIKQEFSWHIIYL